MSISVTCACGKQFRAKDELLGKNVRCPECHASVRVVKRAGEDSIERTPVPDQPAHVAKKGVDEVEQKRKRRFLLVALAIAGVLIVIVTVAVLIRSRS